MIALGCTGLGEARKAQCPIPAGELMVERLGVAPNGPEFHALGRSLDTPREYCQRLSTYLASGAVVAFFNLAARESMVNSIGSRESTP
jgi:hypothetical protein